MSNTRSSILVASDNASDAERGKRLLAAEFSKIFISTVADKAVADFELRQPDVLVLAFNTLEKAERYLLPRALSPEPKNPDPISFSTA